MSKNDDDLPEAPVEKLRALIERIQVAMVTTAETDGSLRARPMAAILRADDPGHVYFLTGRSSHKTDEIARDPRVNLTFARGGDYVSVSGTADFSRDPDLIAELWSETHRPWFPKGRKDPDICVLRVLIDYAEYWDPPSAAVNAAYGWTKAMLTGRSADGDLGERVKLGEPG
jgi:general stress protein 26